MKKPNLLKERIQSLEKTLKERDKLLKKYRRALDGSNRRIEQITKDIEEGLALIKGIHKNLLPVRLPHIPGFELSFKFLPAARGVSGDFFDVVKIKDSMSFGILLSSCGAYAGASLFLSSFLKFSADIQKYKTAKDFLSFAAKKIFSSFSKKEKVHLFYGLISRSSLKLDYCLFGDIFAGRRSKNGDFKVLPSSGGPLYKKKDIKLSGRRLNLQPEDILLICSPGAAQRENKKGELYGEKNIIRSVSGPGSYGALELRQKALFSCSQFGRGIPLSKDCAILTVKAGRGLLRVHPRS